MTGLAWGITLTGAAIFAVPVGAVLAVAWDNRRRHRRERWARELRDADRFLNDIRASEN